MRFICVGEDPRNYSPKTDLEKIGVYTVFPANNQSGEFTIVRNIGFLAGKRGTNYFVAVVDYWTSGVTYVAQNGTKPSLSHSANSPTISYTNDSGAGAYAMVFITGASY